MCKHRQKTKACQLTNLHLRCRPTAFFLCSDLRRTWKAGDVTAPVLAASSMVNGVTVHGTVNISLLSRERHLLHIAVLVLCMGNYCFALSDRFVFLFVEFYG